MLKVREKKKIRKETIFCNLRKFQNMNKEIGTIILLIYNNEQSRNK